MQLVVELLDLSCRSADLADSNPDLCVVRASLHFLRGKSPCGERVGLASAVLAQQGFELCRRRRPAVEEALPAVAPQGAELDRLFSQLDALGHRVRPQGAGEVDDRRDQGRCRRAPVKLVDEAPVDLDGVDRERSEVAERRVPGAEVVDGELHADGLQLGEDAGRPVDVESQHGLGDLEHQTRRRQSGFPNACRSVWSNE